MKKLKYILFASFLAVVTSCDLNLQDDPNALKPDQADIDFLLNSVQFGLNEYFFEVTEYTQEALRLKAMEPRGGTYETAYQPQDFDDMWEQAYAGVLSDSRLVIDLGKESELFVHSGIARVVQAYVLMSLVDFFGDIPWTEALKATGNFNPTTDDDASIYAYAEAQLDSAVGDFNEESLGTPSTDLFYGGNIENWIKLANTLKLKLYLQSRLVDGEAASKINALINNADFIDAGSDWEYPFSTTAQNPDSRHPYFINNYLNGANDYMANYFMNLLYNGKSVVDPRMRYYFYRQTLTNTDDVNEQPCIVRNRPSHYTSGMVYCDEIGDGYWGRDHIDTDGIPPDNLLRTNWGLYPVGGRFDADDDEGVEAEDGLRGAGIHPFMLSSFVEFMLAESALTLGTSGDARQHLEDGIRASIGKVMNFSTDPGIVDPNFAPSVTDVDNYVNEVLANYDAADNAGKLEIIGTEFYIASFGNGLEAYNLYRRTGAPSDMQFALNPQPGSFIRSFKYPAVLVNRNSSVDAKASVGLKVFWDNNPDNFVR